MKVSGTITALLVDDEIEAINLLVSLIKKIDGVSVVDTTTNPDKVLSLYLKYKPDVIFMDVEMGSRTGLDVLQEFHELEIFPIVVFTTAFNSYAITAIKNDAFDYVLKPIDDRELRDVIDKVRSFLEKHDIEKKMDQLEKIVRNHNKLRFNTRSGFIFIHPDEIMYIEASANYSEIHLSLENREIVSMNIGTVEDILPQHFLRISRYHIINTAWLTKVSSTIKKCYLKKGDDEIALSISEKQFSEIKRKLEQ